MKRETLFEAKNRVFNTPICCPSCGKMHTYQQVKDNKYKCLVTNIGLTVGSGLFTDQELKIKIN